MICFLNNKAKQDAIKECQEIQVECKAAVGALNLCEGLARRGVKINAEFHAQVQQSLAELHAEFGPKGG